jgi:hypothetical protein
MQDTWIWIESNRKNYKIITKMVDPKDEVSPSHFLREYWRTDDIIWLSHDIVPNNFIMDDLIHCKFPLCSQATYLMPIHTGLSEPVLNNRVRDEKTGSLRWTNYGEEWADIFATDLVKIGLPVQELIGDVPICPWRLFDNELAKKCPVKTHVHWPTVTHNQA